MKDDWIELGEAEKERAPVVKAALSGRSIIVYIPIALLGALGLDGDATRISIKFRENPPTLKVCATSGKEGGVALTRMKHSFRFQCSFPTTEPRRTITMPCILGTQGTMLLPNFADAPLAAPRRKRAKGIGAIEAPPQISIAVDNPRPGAREKSILPLARMDALQVDKLHRAGIKPPEIAKQLGIEEARVRKHLNLSHD